MPAAVVLSHRDIAHELGHLEPWLAEHGYAVTRIYREDAPDLPAADLLIVMGSPTSVADGYTEPPAEREIAQVSDWVASDRPYLGICFGAQVLARATGGSVARLPQTFRGYVPIDATGGGETVTGPWTVWHNDAITAPPPATVVGRLDHADLVFRVGRAWGVQPHIEVTAESLDRMAIALGASHDERGPLVDAVRADEVGAAHRAHRLLDSMLATD